MRTVGWCPKCQKHTQHETLDTILHLQVHCTQCQTLLSKMVKGQTKTGDKLKKFVREYRRKFGRNPTRGEILRNLKGG